MATKFQIFIMGFIASMLLWMIFSQNDSLIQHLLTPIYSSIELIQLTPMMMEKQFSKLIKERKWNEIISLSNRALHDKQHFEGSFKFWYSTALGECALHRIESCHQSLIKAKIYAGDQYESSIKKMENYLQHFGKRNSSKEQYSVDGTQFI